MSKTTAAVLAAVLAGYLATIFYWLEHPLASDFTKFYASGIQFREGINPYAPLNPLRFDPGAGTAQEPPAIHPNLNPPFGILLLLPLSFLPWTTASLLFALLSLAAGGTAILLLGGELGLPATLELRARCLVLLLLFYPTWATIRFGQLSLLLFLLVVILWRSFRQGRDVPAGIALGILLSLKLFAGLLLLLLVLRQRFRAAAAAVLVGTAGWLLSLLVFGTGIIADYRQVLSRITWTGASWNASLQGFFNRIFGGSEGVPLWPAPMLGRLAATAFAILGALALFSVAKRRLQDPEQADLCFALTLPLMLLLSPLGWMYYFPILLLSAALLWQQGAHFETLGFLIPATLPLPFLEAGAIDGPADWFLYSGAYFYALCWLTVTLYRRARALPR